MTEDEGASIAVSRDIGGRVVQLMEGENAIEVLVTAPDGETERSYMLYVRRLSIKDAALSGILMDSKPAQLIPPFLPSVTTYMTTVGWNANKISIVPEALDPKTKMKVNAADPLNIVLNSDETGMQLA